MKKKSDDDLIIMCDDRDNFNDEEFLEILKEDLKSGKITYDMIPEKYKKMLNL